MLDLLSNQAAIPNFVNNEAFIGSSSFQVLDPHNKAPLHKVSSLKATDVGAVVESSQAAFLEWRKTSIVSRRTILNKAAALLKARLPEFAEIEAKETSNTATWATYDAGWSAEQLEETAAVATSALRGTIQVTDASQTAYLERVPFGVILSCAPWNAPLVLATRSIAAPLMGGNTVILKTSEFSPRTQMVLAQVFHEAGLPAGVLNIVHVAPESAPEVVGAFIAHEYVKKVNFTGSTRVGRIIAKLCGENLKPVVLELGGKAPMLVMADANIEISANVAIFGGLVNSGQVCMATQTVIVHESVSEKFLASLKSQITGIAAAADGGFVRGLFTEASAIRVKEIISEALAKGASIAAGSFDVSASIVQPLVLTGVTDAMKIYSTELFAPVFSVITFKTEEEAIKIANDHPYGLSSAIYTSDIGNGLSMAKLIDSGMVHINGSTVFDSAYTMHGGSNASGFGRFNGTEGIQEFTMLKMTTVNVLHPFF